ncbi:MAG: hypothetical protein KAK00_01530 [Nanoarchaeota archaeon]|nr:hypothetical protein [Nanoarchaeota archaeon]
MGWRDWPYWVRGGMIAFSYSFLHILMYIFLNFGNIRCGGTISSGGHSCNVIEFLPEAIIYILVFAIPLFLIGALIGWIVGLERKYKKEK